VILYEHPFNERVRTWLRLEYLFDRLRQLLARADPLDHHYALLTLFELIEVMSRADLKSEVLQDLSRQKSAYAGFRGNPAVSEVALDAVLTRLGQAFDTLNAQRSKPGQLLAGSEWLQNVRRRAVIPAGTCGFDLPAYHAWLYRPARARYDDLLQWSEDFGPMAQAIALLLQLLRESGQPQGIVAQGGQYVRALTQGKAYQLLRLRIDPALDLIPEITAHRLAVSVNLTRCQDDGKTHLARQDAPIELTFCA
jgi:cell division protein ZapD